VANLTQNFTFLFDDFFFSKYKNLATKYSFFKIKFAIVRNSSPEKKKKTLGVCTWLVWMVLG